MSGTAVHGYPVFLPKKSFRSTLKSVRSPVEDTNESTSQFALGPFHRFQVWPAISVAFVIWEPTGCILRLHLVFPPRRMADSTYPPFPESQIMLNESVRSTSSRVVKWTDALHFVRRRRTGRGSSRSLSKPNVVGHVCTYALRLTLINPGPLRWCLFNSGKLHMELRAHPDLDFTA